MSRKMTKSIIDWAGLIPYNWQLIPNRYLYIPKHTIVGDAWQDYQLLSLTTKGVKQKDINSSGGKVPDSYNKYQIVNKGDMIFCLFDLDVSAVFSGLSNYNGMITSAYDVFKPNNKYISELYSKYWFEYVFSNRYYKIYSKNIRYTISGDLFKSILSPVPKLEEQIKIGSYLEKKINKIDELIKIQEKQIDKLVKLGDRLDSESFDNIPYNTVVKKMNELAFYKKGPFGSSLKVSMFVPKGDNTFKVYEQKNAIYKDINLGYYYIDENKFDKLKSNEVFSGDIIVSCAGTIGECFIIPENAERGIINQALMIVRTNTNVDKQFMILLLENIFRKYGEQYSNGSAMKNIPPFDILKNIRVQIPTCLNDQLNFAKKLIKRKELISKLKLCKQDKIQKLQEYKKSLIYEYVTGKKSVYEE